MNADDARELDHIASHTPRSAWAYVGVLAPMALVVGGVALNLGLLAWSSSSGPVELLMRQGDETVTVMDSELVRRAALVFAACVVLTGGLQAWLGRTLLRHRQLLQRVALERQTAARPPQPGPSGCE